MSILSKIFRRSKPQQIVKAETDLEIRGQLRPGWMADSITVFNSNMPFQHNMGLFNTLRSTFPFIDTISSKSIRLMGIPYIQFDNRDDIETDINNWLQVVKCNTFSMGIDSYIYQTEDNAIMLGFDVSEILPAGSMDVHSLINTNPETFRFVEKGGEIKLAQKRYGRLEPVIIEDMDYINYLAHDQRMGKPQGYSVLYSTPFISQILQRLYKSVDNSLWRIGDPTYFVEALGGETASLQDMKKIIDGLKSQFEEAMKTRREGGVRDIFAGGMNGTTFKISIVGGDGKFIDGLEFAWKDLIEQLLVPSGFPLWYFGFHWTSRESLAKYENIMLIERIKSYQRDFETNCLQNIVDRKLTLTGRAGIPYKIVWPSVDLHDKTEEAKARVYNAQAKAKEVETVILLAVEGFISFEEAELQLIELGFKSITLTAEWWRQKQEQAFVIKMYKQLMEYKRFDSDWTNGHDEKAYKLLHKKLLALEV